MDAFLHSLTLVALGEIGDKTQLLAIVLAARYKRALPIICGIIVATFLNHAIATWVGKEAGEFFNAHWFSAAVYISFVLIGLWVLKPDSLTQTGLKKEMGAFTTTAIMFFMAEIGDKTQLVTIALAAEYKQFFSVLAGTTGGMLVANLPAVFMGSRLLEKVPMKGIRFTAAILFVGFGVLGFCQEFL